MSKFSILWISLPLLTLGAHAPNSTSLTDAHSAPTTSWIVQSSDLDDLRRNIDRVGGEITHELALIDAVAVSLTDAEHAALVALDSTVRLHGDRQVTSASTVPRFADSFDATSYDGTVGNLRWSSSWVEQDDGSPLTGDIALEAGNLRLRTSAALASIARRADLSGAVAASLVVDFTSHLDAKDNVWIEASSDGSTFEKIYKFDAKSAAAGRLELDISEFISADTHIRFRVKKHKVGTELELDNVEIHYTAQAAPGSAAFVAQTGADALQLQGLTGEGIGVAMIDTGLWTFPSLSLDTDGDSRVAARYNAIDDSFGNVEDGSGHGSHIAGIIAGSAADADAPGTYSGVAPDADLVAVKAFNAQGEGSYADVIRGIDWVVANKDQHNIRVLNLSFSAQPLSYYWDDPLNMAVMEAWRAGILVVASAGNGGYNPMSIGVPGNVPYVVTVGAMSDNQTPDILDDDYLADFSSTGPTIEAFVKPEIVAPGHRIQSVMPPSAYFPNIRPDLADGAYFSGSGTSQAAAVTSGIAALLLQADPWLTPDELKCRLMSGAQAAVDADGNLAYSPLQQGMGLVNASLSLDSNELTCANNGLDIDNDLDGTEHYIGPVRYDEDTDEFYILDLGFEWNGLPVDGGFAWTGANPWTNPASNPWTEANANPWTQSNPWTESASNPWTGAASSPWTQSNPWTGNSSNPWVGSSPWTNGIPWDDQPYEWDTLTEAVSIGMVLPD